MSNPFSISFGLEPKEYISRHQQTDRIIDAFTEESPSNHTFIFSLVGKHINSEEVLRLLKMTYWANKRS